MEKNKAHSYEKLVKKLPKEKQKGRKIIKPNLSYDFDRKTYYYLCGRNQDGNKKYIVCKDPYLMESKINKFKQSKEIGNYEYTAYYTGITLEQYMQSYINRKSDLRKSSLTYYNSCKNRICTTIVKDTFTLGDVKLADVKSHHIEIGRASCRERVYVLV